MSYDIEVGDKSRFNYTSNMYKFFRHFIKDTGKGGGLREIDGLKASRAASILRFVMQDINQARNNWGDIAFRERYDAENNWGSVLGASLFLAEVMAACYTYPDETITLTV